MFGLQHDDLLVWLASLSMAGYGSYQIYRAYAAKLGRELDLSDHSTGAVRWVVAVSRFGLAAPGRRVLDYPAARRRRGYDGVMNYWGIRYRILSCLMTLT